LQESALRGFGSEHGVNGMAERRAEGVAERLEHLSAVLIDSGVQEGVVPFQGGAHRGGIPLPETGAALDVREEKSDGSHRQVRPGPAWEGVFSWSRLPFGSRPRRLSPAVATLAVLVPNAAWVCLRL